MRALRAQVVRRRGTDRVKRLPPTGYAENGEREGVNHDTASGQDQQDNGLGPARKDISD